jgi:hypothetical protein
MGGKGSEFLVFSCWGDSGLGEVVEWSQVVQPLSLERRQPGNSCDEVHSHSRLADRQKF